MSFDDFGDKDEPEPTPPEPVPPKPEPVDPVQPIDECDKNADCGEGKDCCVTDSTRMANGIKISETSLKCLAKDDSACRISFDDFGDKD